ncbi:deoxyhypusine synthase, partial [archaeon]
MSRKLREKLLKKPVKDIKIAEIHSFKELIDAMYESGGFTAKKLAKATRILIEMFKDKECTRILAFPACILATGTRGIITDIIKRKLFDVVITTCGSLDHDLARSFKDYYHGYFEADDEMLHKLGINRLGNVFLPNESY